MAQAPHVTLIEVLGKYVGAKNPEVIDQAETDGFSSFRSSPVQTRSLTEPVI
jgi:hypothetical protein